MNRHTIQRDNEKEIRDVFHASLKKYAHQDILLLLSGGSAQLLLAEAWNDANYTQMTMGVIDERWQAQSDERNDVALKLCPFVRNAQSAGAEIISINHNASTIHSAARQYEKDLRTWHTAHTKGVVIAVLGIGADGHTAGIMPFPEDTEKFHSLFESNQWVAGYDATGKNQFTNRVTITMTYLREQVDGAIVYAVDAKKKHALNNIIAERGTLTEIPARIIREMKNVHLFQAPR